ncbi:MAG TPA: alpha/beta hydrolase [Pyrinomonadaceae bacterium]|nr:alpha/beta hydrolase [Pyrinomonadaceae bacterium]
MKKPSVRSETVQVNDIEMYYETHGAGEPLVLLHGGGGVGANWQLIFKEPPAGYELIVPDLRGHGRSTNSSPEFTFQQAALDVYALLDQLGVKQFKAVGVSMGAKTLLHMATQQITRIEAMVLVSAAPYFPEQARVIMRQASVMTHTEAEWRQMREWHKRGDEQILALWRLPESFQNSFSDLNFTPPYLSTITARTLIVHGDRDPLYPVNLAVEMFAAIPSSYLWIVPNGGHGPIFGAHAARFVETTLAFLRGEWRS